MAAPWEKYAAPDAAASSRPPPVETKAIDFAARQPGEQPDASELGLPIPRSPPPGGLIDTSITPGPNVATLLPLSRDDAGNARFAVPNAVRSILTEGPQVTDGRFQTPAATINPGTGQLGVTPEALAGASLFSGGGLRFGNLTREPVSPLTLTRPPPVTLDELNAAITRAGPPPNGLGPGSPGVPPAATASPPGAASPSGAWVPMESGMRYPGQQTRINRDTGRPEVFDPARGAAPETPQPPPQAAQAEAAPPPSQQATPSPSAPPTSTSGAPKTADEIMANAKSVAQQHYDIAKATGQESGYTPQSVNKMVDAVDAAAPQGPGEKAVGGENAVTRLQRDMQPLRDQPLTLADIQAMDERMSDHITEELRAGRNKVAGQLMDVQNAWREQADGVTSADVTGGTAGFQALDPARQAWAQYRKMNDVMLMKQRADMTQNPTSSYQTQVKNYVTGKASRGWSDEEKASLVASADRGVVGGTLHLLGSRLLPHVGGSVGASVGGIPGFLAGEVTTHALGGVARNVANNMQTGRVTNTMGVLGAGVPPPPIGLPQAPGNQLLGPRVANAPGPVDPVVMNTLLDQLRRTRAMQSAGVVGRPQQQQYPPGYI